VIVKDVPIARSGWLEGYPAPTTDHYRSPQALSALARGLVGKPIVDTHQGAEPVGKVLRTRIVPHDDGEHWAHADLKLGKKGRQAARAGRRFLSAQSVAELHHITPIDAKSSVASQHVLEARHLALCDGARCGEDCSIPVEALAKRTGNHGTLPAAIDGPDTLRADRFDALAAPVKSLGGTLYEARCASTAPMQYLDANGRATSEYRDADEVQRIVDQLPGKVVCLNHPDDGMYAQGSRHPISGVIKSARLERDNGETFAVATLDISDPKLLKAIQSGRARGISLGYSTDLMSDGRQVGVQVDHAAVVPQPRCTKCELRADCSDSCSCNREKPMKSTQNDLVAATERARLASQRAYRAPSKWSRDTADPYEAAGIAKPLAQPKLRGADRNSPDSSDLSSRIAKGLTNANAYPNAKAPFRAQGPYGDPDPTDGHAAESDPVGDAEHETASMDLQIAQQRALDRSRAASLAIDPRYSRDTILNGRRQGRRGDAATKPLKARTDLTKAEERARLQSARASREIPEQYSRDYLIARGGQ
jgi:hypothetical protein